MSLSNDPSPQNRRPRNRSLDSIKQLSRDEIRLMLNPTQLAEFEKVLAEMGNNNNKTRDDDN